MKTEDLNFTVLDFETSGLNARTDQIIEACAIRVRKGEPVMVFNALVNFTSVLNPKVTELTGHTIEDLEGGISEEQLAGALHSIIDHEELLVAYNAPFDLFFLEVLFAKYIYSADYPGLPNPFIDPLTIARDRDPYPHKLGDSCKRYGVTLTDAHSAYDDTFALFDLTLAMNKQKPIDEYVNVLGYRRKYGEPDWQPKHAILKPQGTETVTHNTKRSPLVPKSNGAVVTKNTARKRRPDPVVDETTLPVGLVLGVELLKRVEAFENRVSRHLYIKDEELGKVLEYLALRNVSQGYTYYQSTEVEDRTIVEWDNNIVTEDDLPY